MKEVVVVAKKEANALETKQPRPRVDPDDKVDEEALEDFLEELEKLNALPRTIKPPAPSQDPKTPMNADDSSSDSSSDDERLTSEEIKNIEKQIIPVASFQGLSVSPMASSSTLKDVKDSGSLLKDPNTLKAATEEKRKSKEGCHASPLLLEHSKRQEEEEKMVKERIQQTCSSPLSEPLERKEIEKGIGRESAVQRGETGEREENTDIISGREFIKFCVFSVWFAVIMYMTKDLLS